MSGYSDHEILNTYAEQTEKQIIELNKIIVALRSKVAILEKELEARDKVPIPPSVVKQIMELEIKNQKQEELIKYYKKHVNPQVIINKENQEKPTRRGGIPR